MKKCLFVLLSLVIPASVFAQEPCLNEASLALEEANRNRGVVSDLDQMRAWYHDIGHDIATLQTQYGDHGSEVKEELLYGVAWMSSRDTFSRMETCSDGLVGNANLNRGWKGAYGYSHDVKRRFGYELFYLSTKDQLKHDTDTKYAWFQSVAGARGWYRDWLSLSWGRIHRQAPARNPKNAPTSGGMYFNVGIPILNLSTDLITQPGTRKPDLLSVELSKVRFPGGGPSFGFATGYYDREAKVVSTLSVDNLIRFLSFRGAVEYDPFRLRSLELKVTPKWHAVYPQEPDMNDLWTSIDFEPYVEVSMYRSRQAVDRYKMDWIPGGAVGVHARWVFGNMAVGGDAYVGVNRAIALDRLLSSYGRTHLGARFYLRVAL